MEVKEEDAGRGMQLKKLVEDFLATQGAEGKGRVVFSALVGPRANNLTCPGHEDAEEIYAVYVVPTDTLLGIAAVDLVLKERTLLSSASRPSIRVDEAAKFCNLCIEGECARVRVSV